MGSQYFSNHKQFVFHVFHFLHHLFLSLFHLCYLLLSNLSLQLYLLLNLLKLLKLFFFSRALLNFIFWWTFHSLLFLLDLFDWAISCLSRWSMTSCSCSCCYLLFWLRLFNLYFLWRRLFFRDNDPTSIIHFGDNILLSETKTWIDSSSPLFCKIITSSISTIEVIISFKPLRKL